VTTGFLDTNVLVRHLIGDPPDQAARSTELVGSADRLLLPDLVVAELVYVLQSFYALPRSEVALRIRSALRLPSVRVLNRRLLERAIDLYESTGLHFADAYLVACAEASDVDEIVSFDRALDRVDTVRRVEP
jgi:predicted nucleic acid-binding protein